jgi:glutaredoxin-related protein
MKYILIPVLLLAVFAGFLIYKPIKTVSDVPATTDMILFWGEGCPHCETVKKYISENNIEKKLTISQLEVYYNRTNQKLLQEKVNGCEEITDKNQVGVPMAFIPKDGQCLMGDQPIINWLESSLVN